MGQKITDKQKKKIIADYIQCQNYRETGRINNVSYATVKRLVKESDFDLSQEITQKAEINTQDTLSYMQEQHEIKKRIVNKILQAMEQKAENIDMFTNIKDLATAYGIIVDKELKFYEIKQGELSRKSEALQNVENILVSIRKIATQEGDANATVD